MTGQTTAPDLLRQLIELERQHGSEPPGLWDLVSVLNERLAVLPVAEAFALIHNSPDLEQDEGYWACIRDLQKRGDQAVFDTCVAWASDRRADRRQAAADVLGQLGYESQYPFAAASLPVLEGLLADSEPNIIASVLNAFGHLKMGEPSTLAAFGSRPEQLVRFGLVHALTGRDDAVSQAAMIALTRDADNDVRDWATFGLGTLSQTDTPEIRDALAGRLGDVDASTRFEAMVGLAKRRDQRVVPLILTELALSSVKEYAIEAAGMMADPRFLPSLETLLASNRDVADIVRAVEACRSGVPYVR